MLGRRQGGLGIGPPGLPDHELARELRGRPGGDRAVLVALMGCGQRADIAKASAAGFDAPPVRPVEPQHRLALVARLTQA